MKNIILALATLAFVSTSTMAMADNPKDHKAHFACKNFHKKACKKAKKTKKK